MSKFTIVITFLVLPLLYSSCSRNEIYDDDFYALLNDILVQYDSSAIIVDIPTNYKIFDQRKFLKRPPPPNTHNFFSIMENEFNWFIEKNYLIASDTSFMMTQARTQSNLRLDSSKIELKTINREEIDNFYINNEDTSIFHFLIKKFNTSSIIFISKPLFNSTRLKMYLEIDYWCGGLCGYGTIYLFEKRNNEWQIIYQVESWIS